MIAATMFSGIGAPECAAPHWDWRWCAETEAFPSAVLKQRHAHSVNLGDVNAEDFVERAERIGRPDIIVFGSPCQDFSVAGQRVGLDGARGNLALISLRIVKRLRPRWFCFENVPGLFSSYSGSAETERAFRDRAERGQAAIGTTVDADEDSDFAAFLTAVRECGYLGCYRVLDAQFAGVPQRRRRIFFVGYLGDWRPPVAVLFEPESLCRDHPPSRQKGERVAPTVEARANAGGAGSGTDFMSGGGLAATFNEQGHGWFDDADRSQALRKGDTKGGGAARENTLIIPLLANPLTARMHKSINITADEGQTMIPVAFDCKAGANTGFAIGDIPGALRGDGHGGGHAAVLAFSCKDYGNDAATDLSPPLRAMNEVDDNQNAGGQDQVLHTGAAVRRLTPRECERLQGFEDDYSLITYRGKEAADGPRYKSLGNAMNVSELRWILGRIDRFEREVAQ